MSRRHSRRSSSIKKEFSEKELQDLRMAFELCDRNQDGIVSSSEFKIMLSNIGIDLKEDTIKQLMKHASHSGTDLIDENDFLNWVKHIQSLCPVVKGESPQDLVEAFKVFDLDGDGFITRDELRTAMDIIGEEVTENQLDEFLIMADKDKDGRINYEEFVKLLS